MLAKLAYNQTCICTPTLNLGQVSVGQPVKLRRYTPKKAIEAGRMLDDTEFVTSKSIPICENHSLTIMPLIGRFR